MHIKKIALIIIGITLLILVTALFLTSNDTQTPSTKTSKKSRSDAPLYFTTMTHMEGDFKDDKDEAVFQRHIADLRDAIVLFDAYGAKLTVESGASFAKANSVWGVNFLREVVNAQHGVGTHAEFEADTFKNTAVYSAKYKEAKSLVDALVGAENNQGVSGGFAAGEWVEAAAHAGFGYLDGLTALGYLSMPLKNRPDGYTDAYIRRVAYHDSIPPDFAERLYMYDLKDATDLVPDADGILTIMGGELGELSSLAEGRSTCAPNCTFDETDIAAVVAYIKQADDIRDRSKVARLNVHIPTRLLTDAERPMLKKLLDAIKPYADDGTIIFATQLEAYQGYKNF